MPRGGSDGTLVSVGRLRTGLVLPVEQLFIANGLPEDFLEKLKIAIEQVHRSIREQEKSGGNRLHVVMELDHTRRNAIATLRRVDPIMDNLLRDDPPLLAVWRRARRVERSNGGKTVEQPPVAAPA